jgi:hypothetical protein
MTDQELGGGTTRKRQIGFAYLLLTEINRYVVVAMAYARAAPKHYE